MLEIFRILFIDFFRCLYYDWWLYFLYYFKDYSPCVTYIVMRDLEKPLHSQAPIKDLNKGFSILTLINPEMINDFNNIKIIEYRGWSKNKILLKPMTYKFIDYYRNENGDFYRGSFDSNNKYYVLCNLPYCYQQSCTKNRNKCDQVLSQEVYIKTARK